MFSIGHLTKMKYFVNMVIFMHATLDDTHVHSSHHTHQRAISR